VPVLALRRSIAANAQGLPPNPSTTASEVCVLSPRATGAWPPSAS
jgi:hypothetical protein